MKAISASVGTYVNISCTHIHAHMYIHVYIYIHTRVCACVIYQLDCNYIIHQVP